MKIKDPNYQGFFGETLTHLFEDIGNQPHTSKAEFYKYPKEIYPLLALIYPSFTLEECEVYNTPFYDIKPSQSILVGFSCGKDSVANIIKLKNKGYNVIAFSVKGINRQYPEELNTAEELCNLLNVPLIVYNIRCQGTSEYFENPIKNLLILSYMLDYGVREGITNYSLGNYEEDILDQSNILFNYSDSYEVLKIFEQFVQTYFPNYKYIHGFSKGENPYKIIVTSTYDTLEVMNLVYSCMTTHRFRGVIRNKNIDTYKIDYPLQGRCFGCYKCAYEYITLTHLGLVPINLEFYKRCHQILYSKLEQVFNVNLKTDKIDKSKLYKLYGIPSTKTAMEWINKKDLN